MRTRILLSFVSIAILAVIIQACGNSSDNTQNAGAFACSASGSLVSGDPNTGGIVVLSGVAITVLNPTGSGPFLITLPGGQQVTSTAATYNFPSTLQVTSQGGGIIPVTVADNSNGANATCSIITSGGTTTGFTTGISTSTTGTTSSGSGQLIVYASPGTSVNAGTTVTLTAQDTYLTNVTYTFQQISGNATIQSGTNGTAYVYSSSNQVSTILVTARSLTTGQQDTLQGTIVWGSGGTTGQLTCTVTHSGYPYVGQSINFNITSSTGETLRVVQWDAGEPWDIQPSYPLYAPWGVAYGYSGTKYNRFLVESASRPGVYCNGGIITDYVTIY